MKNRIRYRKLKNHPSQLKYLMIGTLTALSMTACLQIEELGNELLSPSPSIVSSKQIALAPSDNCNELQTYLTNALLENYTKQNYYGYQRGPFPPAAATGGAESDAINANLPPSSLTDVSKTNTQEAGVDELDWIKTDADGHIYIAQANTLYIVDAYPPENMQSLSKIDLGMNINGLYIDEQNQYVIAIGNKNIIYPDANDAIDMLPVTDILPRKPDEIEPPQFILTFVSMADKQQPIISKTIHLDGNFMSSRLIGDRIHLISGFQFFQLNKKIETTEFYDLLNQYQRAKQNENDTLRDQLRTEIQQAIQQALNASPIAAYLPQVSIATDNSSTAQLLTQCADILKPDLIITPPQLLNVTTITSDGGQILSTAIMQNGWQTYASKKNLYVSQASDGWFWASDEPPSTAIHKFDISAEKPIYLASGQIAGTTNNSFAYSEYQDYLRVTTTESRFDPTTNQSIMSNHLFILEQQLGELAIVGSVKNFAPDEQIFASRYIDDVAFVVTFRQTDPLFAFDLSDPKAPVIKGELKIPGFSTYMHPIDKTHLLTIGRGGDETRADNTLQLQIFDVSDLTNPIRTAAHTLADSEGDYSWSEALSNPHAFSYYSPLALLAIPFSNNNWQSRTQTSGIGLFSISLDNGISLIGTIDHDEFFNSPCEKLPPDGTSAPRIPCEPGYLPWGTQPNRTVFMSDEQNTFIYTLSNLGIKAANTDNITNVVGDLIYINP